MEISENLEFEIVILHITFQEKHKIKPIST